jgi:hypothetical protein
MCPYWASQAQCEANPAYMVGDKKHIGHCKFSCKACTQSECLGPLWAGPAVALKVLFLGRYM